MMHVIIYFPNSISGRVRSKTENLTPVVSMVNVHHLLYV